MHTAHPQSPLDQRNCSFSLRDDICHHDRYLLLVRRTATAWSSPGDMLALALKSTPSPGVKNTGAGAHRFDTWSHEMQVRDTGDANLELFCRHDDNDAVVLKRVKVGKKYS
jgi:hypothetical protein